MKVDLSKEFIFEAAHRHPHLPPEHKCSRIHGHSFKVEIFITGEVDPRSGWFIDFNEISKAFAPLSEELDHRYLNEVPGLENPSAENIAKWIYDRMKKSLPCVTAVTLHETHRSRCTYRGE